MGWWGHDVLSGDGPLDTLGWLGDELGVGSELDVYPSGTIEDPQVRSAVRARLDGASCEELTTLVRRLAGWKTDDAIAEQVAGWSTPRPDEVTASMIADRDQDVRIVWQVLAVVAMAAGAVLDGEAREVMVAAGTDDDWAAEEPARRAAMDRYVACLRSYTDGAPTALASATLGDAFAKAVEVGHTGLLNVDPPRDS